MTQSPETPSEQASISRRKRARLDRIFGEAMEVIANGERRTGKPDLRIRKSLRLGSERSARADLR